MTGEVHRLEEQLRRALEGEAWEGSPVLESLAGHSAAQAASHPIAGAHNIFELVLHLGSDYTLVLRRLAGDARRRTADDVWPACPASTGENRQQTVQELKLLNRTLRDEVRDYPVERLDDPLATGVPCTAHTQFIGIAQHKVYHAGQIALLKRALAATAASIDEESWAGHDRITSGTSKRSCVPSSEIPMKWYHFLACFFAGAFLANAAPHFVHGVSGDPFPSPFAQPPGKGLSSPTVNVLWGLSNFFIGYLLLRLGKISHERRWNLFVLFLGVITMSIMLSVTFADRIH